MANKMLIDATHPEETRVVVLRGNRVEEFDFETAQRKQLRGNIYLAKVTRVEPSLQAAFVDYGGNRHGFLAFSEIHPDYYQIPVADRQALIDEEGRAQRAADDEDDRRSRRHRGRGRPHQARRDSEVVRGELAETSPEAAADGDESGFTHTASDSDHHSGEHAGTAEHEVADHETGAPEAAGSQASFEPQTPPELPPPIPAEAFSGESGQSVSGDSHRAAHEAAAPGEDNPESAEAAPHAGGEGDTAEHGSHEDAHGETAAASGHHESSPHETAEGEGAENGEDDEAAEEIVESVGGSDALEEVPDRAPRHRRQYKIQEVIKRRQVMLVQVVKEERGTKGAALTTYLSLAGRYSVLMPNTARGGGISRKITSGEDRSRLKEIAGELEVPEGMGVIVRTAGASRTKTEIKRDFEYLLRLWETVRDLTLKSTAPKLVYEEGSLVKRSIRDLYSKDIDEVIVAGPDSYHEAKDFMRMLMPSHAKNVKLYGDTQPLLSRYGVENQLDGMFSPVVQLRSGGYIVLNQAEALVAIDVNSGRATREHHIEDTALKTNLEAADEIARQLRLRDLAGLVVIDFIDMDEKRNNRSVERRLKECLKHDRARIQVGRISHFGLLEMSRQRIRTSVLESSTEKCPYCGGSGHVRSVSSLALQVLRALEEQLMKGATHNLIARTRPDVALYVLNQKRAHLRALEERFAITITISADTTLVAPQAFIIDRGDQVHTIEAAKARAEQTEAAIVPLEEEDELEDISGETADEIEETEDLAAEEPATDVAAEQDEAGAPHRRRRRRRRGRNGGGEAHALPQQPRHDDFAEPAGEPSAPNGGDVTDDEHVEEAGPNGSFSRDDTQRDGERRRRRRGRRGGRRNRPERTGEGVPMSQDQEHHEPQDFHTPDSQAHDANARDFQPQDFQPQDFQPQDFQTGGDLPAAQATTGPELAHAGADLDSAPPAPARRSSGPADSSAHTAISPAPPAPPAAAEAPVQQPEPPRRRSTVREPAPVANATESPQPTPAPASPPAPAPQPVITELGDSESTDRPRRSGWWSRRFAGG